MFVCVYDIYVCSCVCAFLCMQTLPNRQVSNHRCQEFYLSLYDFMRVYDVCMMCVCECACEHVSECKKTWVRLCERASVCVCVCVYVIESENTQGRWEERETVRTRARHGGTHWQAETEGKSAHAQEMGTSYAQPSV